jgi:nucleoside-diphosphate-sugar epimerase
VDVVVHLAGTPDDADFASDILPNNVLGMHNLLQAAVAHR